MIGRPLAAHSPRAVHEVLCRYGWEDQRALAAAGSVEPIVILLEQVPDHTIEALVRYNRQLGIDLLTGEGWVLLAGSRSRLAAFARPWMLPSALMDLATTVGLALPGVRIETWQTARGTIKLDQPVIMGILNLTPDSFSDGGRYPAPEAALAHVDQMLRDGADVIDLGGESTRPGAVPVPESEEIRRIVPVIDAIVRHHPTLHVSVDTVKSPVARSALEHGAAIINDVSGLRLDPAMAAVAASYQAGLVLMHSRGTVSDMASTDRADYGDDIMQSLLAELRQSFEEALAAGVLPDALVLDPGLGFAKTAEQSLAVLDQISSLGSLTRPILVGPSRKRFLGVATGLPVEDRDRATATACVMAFERGAQLFRVHNVALTREALAVAAAVRGGK